MKKSLRKRRLAKNLLRSQEINLNDLNEEIGVEI